MDAADAAPGLQARLDTPAARLRAALGEPDLTDTAAAALHLAALREVFEECGLLAAAPLDAPQLARARRLHRDGRGFEGVLAALDLRLAVGALAPWSRWVTPLRSISMTAGRRFDTRFFVLPALAGQEPEADDYEAVATRWLRPREALERYWSREIAFAPPQVMSLAHLARHATVAEVLAEAAGRPPPVVRPHNLELDPGRPGVLMTVYPGDPAHPQPGRVMPGPLRLVPGDGRLEPPGGFEAFFA